MKHYPARESFQGLLTKEEFLNYLRVSAAGKAAEMEFCGLHQQTLGVYGDFMSIRGILNAMARAGMFGVMGATGPTRADAFIRGTFLTPDMQKAAEETFQNILTETRIALRENAEIVEALVDRLMEQEELLADEAREFFDQYGLYTPDPVMVVDGEEVSIFVKPKEVEELPAGN